MLCKILRPSNKFLVLFAIAELDSWVLIEPKYSEDLQR